MRVQAWGGVAGSDSSSSPARSEGGNPDKRGPPGVKGGGGRRTRPGKGSEPELGRAREGKREGKERKKGKKEVGWAKREKGEKRMFSIFLKWIQTNSN